MLVKVQRIRTTEGVSYGTIVDAWVNPDAIQEVHPYGALNAYEVYTSMDSSMVITDESFNALITVMNGEMIELLRKNHEAGFDAGFADGLSVLKDLPPPPVVARLMRLADDARAKSFVNSYTGLSCAESDPDARFDVHTAWDTITDLISDMVIDARRTPNVS